MQSSHAISSVLGKPTLPGRRRLLPRAPLPSQLRIKCCLRQAPDPITVLWQTCQRRGKWTQWKVPGLAYDHPRSQQFCSFQISTLPPLPGSPALSVHVNGNALVSQPCLAIVCTAPGSSRFLHSWSGGASEVGNKDHNVMVSPYGEQEGLAPRGSCREGGGVASSPEMDGPVLFLPGCPPSRRCVRSWNSRS